MGTTLTTDTWGIPGPTFLVIYLILAVAAIATAVAVRRRIVAVDGRARWGLNRRPEEVAYLNGGPQLAVYAALSAMHVDGTIVTSDRTTGQVRAGAAPGRDATALQRAIHTAAHRLTPSRTLRTHEPVTTELESIASALESSGLLLTPAARARYRRTALLPGAVALLGALRLAAGFATGHAVGFLVVLTVLVTVAAVVMAGKVPHRTRAGDTALDGIRDRHRSLAPHMRPEWGSVGAGAAALSVGAFGVSAMVAAEPAFAEELAAQKASALGAAGGSGGAGGGSDGGSSGDGGGFFGSFGGGSFGGSSCGGGGGGCGGGGGGCGG
ncbi:TIGR04222 domain-containing membrane protein [Pseudonocardia phyllosphaerae]|uniref:TIGR04222 domain-containing membrane protein n=1 Tax=Pseudonocardia phyllosphaerae TaxID=3390502 RepID=UPI00397BFE5A